MKKRFFLDYRVLPIHGEGEWNISSSSSHYYPDSSYYLSARNSAIKMPCRQLRINNQVVVLCLLASRTR